MKSSILKIATFAFLLGTVWLSSCKTDDVTVPVANKIAPDSAAAGKVLTLTGTGLSDMSSIVFEKGNVPASFVSTLNTDNNLIFRVPDTANGGIQNIIFTNKSGASTSVSFKVIALPTVSSVDKVIFGAGRGNITLTGNNLGDVSKVTVSKATTACTIISKSKKKLVVQMPATNLSRFALDITNASGVSTTATEFINADVAVPFFDEKFADGFGNASWGDDIKVTSDAAYSGKYALAKTYAKGNWHLAGLGWGWVPYSADYKYIVFAIKGGSLDYDLWLTLNTQANGWGFGDFSDKNQITVKAGVWNFYKLPLNTIDFWAAGKNLQAIGWRIKGPDAQDETFYFDDIMLVK
jgi:hypothetical protein